MSKKLDKLKEINTQLSNILVELETRMFIENINVFNDKLLENDKHKVIAEIK
jgi:hypothetical protein